MARPATTPPGFATVGMAAADRRIAHLSELAEVGLSRVIGLLQQSADSDGPLQALGEDARAAGVEIEH